MVTDSSTVHHTHNLPGASHSPRQDGSPTSWKGKKPMYPRNSWDDTQDLQPMDHPQDPLDPERPTLLARIHIPLSERISTGGSVDTSSLETRLGPAVEDGEIEQGQEGEDSLIAYPNVQDAPRAQSTSTPTSTVVGVKAEEIVSVIPEPEPTKERPAGRARGSRSTIDVFGEPVSPETESQASPVRSLQRETTLENSVNNCAGTGEPSSASSAGVVVPQPTTIITSGSAGKEGALLSSPIPLSPSPTAESSSSAICAPAVHVNNAPVKPPDSSVPPLTSSKPSPYPASVLEQCRDLMIPLISHNAKVRRPGVDEARVKERAQALLTDERCTQFIRLALEARKQSRIGPKRARIGSEDPSEPPSKMQRIGSPEDAARAEEDESPVASVTHSASEAEVDELMAPETESHSPERSTETNKPTEAGASGPERGAQSPQDSRGAMPPDSSQTTDRQPDDKITADGIEDDEDMHLSRSNTSDLPPASTARSRTLFKHALGEASLPLPTIISGTDADSQSISPNTPLPKDVKTADSANTETTPRDATTPDASRHGLVTPPSRASLCEQERVAPPLIVDDMQDTDRQATSQEEQLMPCVVPGLWCAVVGRSSPGIENQDFFVDDGTANAAACWARRRESFSLNDRHVAVHLLCLPQGAVASAFQNIPLDASPGDIAEALWEIKPAWPPQGRLVVQVNFTPQNGDSCKNGRAWLPIDLTPDMPHLDITPWIRRGKNTINLIQLADLSDRFFVIHAAEPSETEKQAVPADMLAWSHVARWTSQSPSRVQPPIAISGPAPLLA